MYIFKYDIAEITPSFVFVVKEYNIALKLTNKTTSHIFLETMSRQIPTQFLGRSLAVGLSDLSFLPFKTKKDAAAIPNAASRLPYSKKVKQLLCVVFCSLIFETLKSKNK